MFVVCVTIWVKSGFEQKFIEATRDNHENTRKEPGNLRFDVLQKEDEPTRFFLYEVYRAARDFDAHKQTSHYQQWSKLVADWMAKAREGVRHTSLFPPDSGWR
jgi:autoinducer 2-degrading protein